MGRRRTHGIRDRADQHECQKSARRPSVSDGLARADQKAVTNSSGEGNHLHMPLLEFAVQAIL